MVLAWIAATLSTRQNGLFTQLRIGRHGVPFRVLKIRTMRALPGVTTTATATTDPRITTIGRWLRKLKLDELPQLFQVFVGQMSFVGPRPDVSGFADRLAGEDRAILTLRPGLTGPATLAFRDEEDLLAAQDDPERYNREVIYPAKVRLNRAYLEDYTLAEDLRCIIQTVFPRKTVKQ
jgi:lipopolysaccharide/colanic/teichoic acid biosynthesis glycosyltransferase